MSNEAEAEAVPDVKNADDNLKPKGGYIGGEITIITDARTGAMSVNAPGNLMIALGMLEVAKAILIERQQKAVAKMQEAKLGPAIVRADPQQIAKLGRLS